MRESYIFYASFDEALKELPDKSRLKLYDAISDLALRGIESDKLMGVEKAVFSLIKPQLLTDLHRYENGKKGGDFGKLGGRPKNPKKTPKKPQENPKETPQAVFENGIGFSREKEPPTKENPNKEKATQKEINPKETYTQEKENINPLCISPTGGKKKDFEEEFFTLYPRYAKDRAKMRVDVDYKRLIEEFGKSKYLRSLYTVKQINEEYPLILQGDYRDKEKQDPFAGVNARAERDSWYAKRRASAEGKASKILERFLEDEEFKRIHRRLNAMQCELAKAEVGAQAGDTKAHNQLIKLTQEEERLKLQRRGIIERNGYEEEDLQPKWHCRKCSDTGYDEDGRACDCYNKGE